MVVVDAVNSVGAVILVCIFAWYLCFTCCG